MMTEPQNDSLSPTKPRVGAVSQDNFGEVWNYILGEIESGRWGFADWPLENLQEIPLEADAEGKAVKDLNKWINRHLKIETQHKMFQTIDPDWSADSSKPTTNLSTDEAQVNPAMDILSSEPQVIPTITTDVLESSPDSKIDEPSAELIIRPPTEAVSQEPTTSSPVDNSAAKLIIRPPTEAVSQEPTTSSPVDNSAAKLII
ncbi:MAG: hypothetical protein HQL68_08645, partial [Magnetococcales bacterium]|nr:hypothetical protein [Magnetococcales bacterium]